VLAVGDEFVFGETLDGEDAVLDSLMPREEMASVVVVAAQGRGARSSFARLARNGDSSPDRWRSPWLLVLDAKSFPE